LQISRPMPRTRRTRLVGLFLQPVKHSLDRFQVHSHTLRCPAISYYLVQPEWATRSEFGRSLTRRIHVAVERRRRWQGQNPTIGRRRHDPTSAGCWLHRQGQQIFVLEECRDCRYLPSRPRGLLEPAHSHRTLSTCQDRWRRARPILRSYSSVRDVRVPSCGQLPLPWRLRRQREAESRDHPPPPLLQNQVSRELLPFTRKSRMCQRDARWVT
jgi:hypothetical protein